VSQKPTRATTTTRKSVAAIFPAHEHSPTIIPTMTLSKSGTTLATPLQSAMKQKRAVSFRSSVKFDAPTKKASSPCDSGLQSIDKRRRYMRRGSKSPSMFKLSPDQIQKIALPSYDEIVQKNYTPSKKERRLSLMSALKVHLERASIVDRQVTDNIRGMSTPSSRRNYTFELLSKVQQL